MVTVHPHDPGVALNLGGRKVELFYQNNLETATVAKGRVDLCCRPNDAPLPQKTLPDPANISSIAKGVGRCDEGS